VPSRAGEASGELLTFVSRVNVLDVPCHSPAMDRRRDSSISSPRPTHDKTEGEQMDILEIEQKETMSREEAAARLRTFADNLARNNDIEFERGGMHVKIHVPDEVQVKVELELETDERELEIELSW
jgi:amphi-Trp domain-containing protein